MGRLHHLLAFCLAVGLATLGTASALPLAAPVAGAAAVPKVVVIVGPVGALTEYYRGLADQAVAAGRAAGAEVVPLYSPDATWPAVRGALGGASLVVYLGHGYGHPSPYRSTLNAAAQDGLGLNIVAGAGDANHQYFGERYLARDVRLAPGAIVVLSHLCYASGNPEPGGPEPTLAVAEGRVDNFAAGWLAAGAGAVVAEGQLGPAWYVRGLLSGAASIGSLWRRSPTFHGNVLSFASARTAGATAALDPDAAGRGYFRSLVVAAGAGRLPVTSGPGGPGPRIPAGGPTGAGSEPSLAAVGVTFGTPTVSEMPVAGRATQLALPATLPPGIRLPAGLQLGVRWSLLVADPLAPTPEPLVPADPLATPAPPPGPSPVGGRGEPAAGETGGPPDPPMVELITPESDGLVTTAPATFEAGSLRVEAALPRVPGLYRLVTTLHGPDGVALEPAVQALMAPLIVRVTPSFSATYGAWLQVSAIAGEPLVLPVRVTNTGTVPWTAGPADPVGPPSLPGFPSGSPTLVGRWVALGAAGGLADASLAPAFAPASLAPGASDVLRLVLATPARPGDYLVVLDIDTPDYGSLAAAGVPPGTVHVVVGPARLPDPAFLPERAPRPDPAFESNPAR